jgi:hypothetical protein
MNEIDNRYLDLYKAIWVQALKQEFKAQKWRLTRDVGAAKEYFPRLRKAVRRKIWREHEAWPENHRGPDLIYEKEYQEIVKEATNDKARVARNTEPKQGN